MRLTLANLELETERIYTAYKPRSTYFSVSPVYSQPLLHRWPILVPPQLPWLAGVYTSLDSYVDGSWYPLPGTAESILGEAGTHTGGCSLIFVATSEPFSSGMVIIRMDARSRSPVHGGGADYWNWQRWLRARYFYIVWASRTCHHRQPGHRQATSSPSPHVSLRFPRRDVTSAPCLGQFSTKGSYRSAGIVVTRGKTVKHGP